MDNLTERYSFKFIKKAMRRSSLTPDELQYIIDNPYNIISLTPITDQQYKELRNDTE